MIDDVLDEHAPSRTETAERARFMLPMTSVIIPTLNEEDHIEGCLQSLLALPIPRYSFEVVVVDNGSTDRTIERASAFETLLDLTILRREDVHISSLRNYGASQSSGDILAFLDADCVASPSWLGGHDPLLARLEKIGVLGAPYTIPRDSTWVARVWDQAGKVGISEVRYVPAGCMLMRRSVFDAVGGFDESIETNEDVELCGRIKSLGLSVIADQSVAVVHLGTAQTIKHFYKRQLWHGAAVFKVFLRSPGRSGNEKVVLLAVYTLICGVLAVGGLVAGGAYGEWIPLAGSVALCLAPPAALSAKRAWSSHRWAEVPAMALLNLVYAIARAHSLLRSSGRKR